VSCFAKALDISVYANATSGALSTIPRHREINDFLARKICKDLDVEPPTR
jgi:hypothetical protein